MIILADGGPCVGGGHLSRCKTIAHEMKQMGRHIQWIVPEEVDSYFLAGDVFVKVSSFSVKEINEAIDSLALTGNCDGTLLADGYRFSEKLLIFLRKKYFLILFDDYRHLPVEKWGNVVINYNVGAENIPYGPEGLKLLGPSFFPLRSSLKNINDSNESFCLFLAGASDIAEATIDVVSWHNLDWPPFVAVLGPMVSDDYFCRVKSISEKKKNLFLLRSPENFDEIMSRASLVICTSSVTCYESLSLGKTTIVFQVGDDQVRIGKSLSELGWVTNLGWWGNNSSRSILDAISRSSPPPLGCVSTGGARRIVDSILSCFS